jgi:hypothetical protein
VLTAIKLLHTFVWAFLAAGILALPVVGVLRRSRSAAILTRHCSCGMRAAGCQWRQVPTDRFGIPIYL